MEQIEFNSPLDVINYLESNNGKLIINIAIDAVGHVLAEFDNFMRMRLTGEIAPDGGHIYMGPNENFVATISEMYGSSLCSNYLLSPVSLELVSTIANIRPDLIADVGISSFKIAPIDGVWMLPSFVDNKYYNYRIPFEKMVEHQRDHYRRRMESCQSLPMAKAFSIPFDLEEFLSLDERKTALIHIKDHSSAGGAEAVDPNTYLPALEYLIDTGYKLIFAGREKYPEIFSSLGVINYANSDQASFKNDLILFNNADFSIVGPSGVCQFAEMTGMPFVYLNSWRPLAPTFSPFCVMAPALAKSRTTGKFLSFNEQHTLFNNRGVYFPSEEYEPIKPSCEDILAATQEAIELKENTTEANSDQKKLRAMAPDSTNTYSLSRTSAAFLKRYQNLL